MTPPSPSGSGHALLLAHGVASRQDLPLPFSYALVGAVAALVVSFAALGLLWRTSRWRGAESGRPLPVGLARFVDAPALRWALRGLGLALAGFVAVAVFAGPDLATNPAAGLIYVVFWVGLVPVSLAFGPVWRLLNPLRTVHLAIAGLLRVDARDGPFELPRRLGYWPGAVSLFSFVWLELAAANSDSTEVLRTYLSIYAGAQLLGAMAFGSRWFDRGDGFEVFSTLIGRLSVFARRADGVLVVRNPLENLDATRAAPGLAAVVAVMLGSTAFDALTRSVWWLEFSLDADLDVSTLSTLGLLAVILIVGAAYVVGTRLAGLVGDRSRRGGQLPTVFAHSLVPIAVGYLIAHYFSLLVFGGQQALIRASDPLVDGANLFGTAELEVNFGLLSVTAIAVVQVVAIIAGHVLGVFAAHDRSVRLFPARAAVTGQIPLMTLMIAYTVGGLSLLFAG